MDDSPPSARSYRDKAKFLRQGVRISGLGTATFQKATQGLGDIVALFSRTVSKIQPPSFVGVDEHGPFMDVSTRYFSSARDKRGGVRVPFSSDVDPTGALAAIDGPKYYHGEENSVLYLERHHNKSTGRKW